MRRFTPRYAAAGVLLLISLSILGCGPDHGINFGGNVTGNITLDGKPVGGGEVIIADADGKHSMSGRIRNDGSYTILDPPLGACKLAVVTSGLKHVPPKREGIVVDYTDRATGEWPIYVRIPAKYEKTESSGLTVDVKRGQQTHDIPLTAHP